MEFHSLYDQGFARVAAVTLPVAPANPTANARATMEQVRNLNEQGVALAVFPELGLSGYAIDDLLMQDVLLDEVLVAIETIRKESKGLTPIIVVGAPLKHRNRLYNCAVVIHDGVVNAVVPKSVLPNYREFYEKRHFTPGDDQRGEWITLRGVDAYIPWHDAEYDAEMPREDAVVPFGPDLLIEVPAMKDFILHIDVCEDMWIPVPPSAMATMAGATVVVNLSGSPITVGRSDDRKLLAKSASFRCNCAYIYAAAGEGESSTDLAWDGETFIYELGNSLAHTERFPDGPRAAITDIDLRTIAGERVRQGSFDDNRRTFDLEVTNVADTAAPKGVNHWRRVTIDRFITPTGDLGLRRSIDRFPFVPDDPARLAQDCYEAYNIQVSALEQRLRAIGNPKIVIGVSGGLDSTQALIVAARAMDRLGRPRSDILAFTMPGFATSETTKSNAIALMEGLGCTWEEIDIRPAATQMLKDMNHPYGLGECGPEVYDVTFENVQAGLRTDFLFRLANERGGIVLGTGDLSELALGWCTFGVGDQMSHYGVNAGIPKTLIQHLIRWVVSEKIFDDAVGQTLLSVLGTEISPELVPSEDGSQIQSTQAKIGPYALQDFTLYHVLRHGAAPSRIAFLAEHAWRDASVGLWPEGLPDSDKVAYDLSTIRHWMVVFFKRFFANQFKRSTLPNGPKVVSGGTLSPRGDWRMPSDVSSAAWIAELERNVPGGEFDMKDGQYS
ncbi:NAD(+) synthase [Actinomyces vulturis]|uniref:NAD(+) synthase n=1 Tax=Actinomyces vulturis TaxID=1857645 RepID=UPI0009F1E52A|nr:NAD(+) synthase [Actinomyces vulturis]